MVGKKVLIVDDEPAIRDVLSRILELSDYQVLAAASGEQGLQLFDDWGPDLIISDVSMPVMDGHQFCSKIRERSDLPIMMLSGQVDLESETEKLANVALRINSVMSKPVRMQEFIAAVEKLVNESDSGQNHSVLSMDGTLTSQHPA